MDTILELEQEEFALEEGLLAAEANKPPSPPLLREEEEVEVREAEKKTNKRPIFLLLPSVLLAAVALLLLAPIMPSIKVAWFDNDFKQAQQISGIMSSCKFLLNCLFSPFLGKLSDMYGRKPLIRVNNLGIALPVFALYLTSGQSPQAYFATLVACGVLTSGQQFLFVAYVADCTCKADRAKMFGLLGAVHGFAFILTPFLVSTVFADWDNTDLFKLALALLVCNALWIEAIVPESLIHKTSGAVAVEGLDEEASSKATGTSSMLTSSLCLKPMLSTVELNEQQRKLLFWLCAFVFVTHLPESGVGEIALIYLNDVLNVKSEAMRGFTASYLLLTGVGLFASQTLYIRLFRARDSHRTDRLLVISTVANVAHMWIYVSLATNHSLSVAYWNIFVTSFMFVGMIAVNALISKQTNEREQGYMLGAIDSMRSFTGALGPVLFSFMYSYFGEHHDYPEAPFVFGGVFASLALLIVIGPLRLQRAPEAIPPPPPLQEEFVT